jgi:filamentous hemagglutinin family protein
MVLNAEAIMKTCHSDAKQGGANHSSRVSGILTLHPLAWALACLIAPGLALAELPTGFNPVSGSVTQNLATPGAMTLQQNSERAIVNWNSFSIGGQNRVDISQPGVSSMLLNRVTGGLPSEIAGSLTANGRVFLVNPSGVVFGAGSRVSTGGLVASTLDISNDDFNAGRLNFSRADGNQAAVINRGNLQAGPGGTIALLGAVVRNEGSIKADGGTAALVSARQLSLDFQGDGLTTFRIDPNNPASHALVQNATTGVVQADGGRIAILADAGSAAQLVVNQQGVLRARSLVQREGEIILGVGSDDRAEIGGVLDASGDVGLRGGKVNITGGGLYLNDQAIVDVGGATGGGRVDVQAIQSVTLATGAKLNADARVDGKGGTLNLQGGASLRAYGTLQARGAGSGVGGFVETSATAVDLGGITVQTTGAPGQLAGTWVIDPFDIRVVHLACCTPPPPLRPVLSSPFDTVTDSSVYDSDISAALNTGSSVIIHTGAANSGGANGNIFIAPGVDIQRTVGTTPVDLRFNANGWIMGTEFAITSLSGPLNIFFNSNSNNLRPQDAFIAMSHVDITTNGGSVNFYGQSDLENGAASSASRGVDLNDVSIDTVGNLPGVGGGNIVIRGRTTQATGTSNFGVGLSAVSFNTDQGDINIRGENAGGTYGLLMQTGLDLVEGEPIIKGNELTTESGNITLIGMSGVGGGALAPRLGLSIIDTVIGTQSGNINLLGRVSSAHDGLMPDIAIGQIVDPDNPLPPDDPLPSTQHQAGGLDIGPGVQIISDAGNISLAGESTGGSTAFGLRLNGDSDGNDVDVEAGNQLQIRAAADNPDTLAFALDESILAGSVSVNFRPGGVSANGELTDHVSTPIQLGGGFDGDDPVSNFQISQEIIDQVTTPLLIIGSDIQTGPIVVASSTSIGRGTQLTLQAEGSGGSIDIRAPLEMARGRLALLADGLVSQSQTGIITTGQLVASSRNASVLLNLSNDIGRFAGSAATELRVTDRTDDLLLDDLAFGAMSGDASIQRQLAGTRAGTNTVLTVGEGDLLQLSAANVVTDGLLAISTRGSVQLNNAGNASRVVAGQSAQTFSYTNGTGLTLGNVAGAAGVRANQVVLRASSGDVTQIAGADINSESLLVESAAGNVLLNNPGNAPHVLAGRAAQAFSFTNLDNLSIGTVDGVSGVQAGSVFIRNLEGDLALDQPVTATAGSAVLVTGGRLQNPTGQTISASSFWQIWANTWIGENRGALAGSGSLPNLYGCAFGGACASAAGLAATAGDNHFIYLQQPTAQITIGSGAGPFGFTPRFRTSISGLILGDSGNGISGSPDSEFSQIARPGTFSVGGTFTSAEGYLLTVVPGTWTNYLTAAVEARPDWTRERPDTWLYDHNMGGAAMCAAPGVTMASAVQEGDVLSREWSLVKSRPKLSSCVASDKQNGCSDF